MGTICTYGIYGMHRHLNNSRRKITENESIEFQALNGMLTDLPHIEDFLSASREPVSRHHLADHLRTVNFMSERLGDRSDLALKRELDLVFTLIDTEKDG